MFIGELFHINDDNLNMQHLTFVFCLFYPTTLTVSEASVLFLF